MRLDRVLIAVPLLGGALLTGTAFAQGLGVNPSVRDVVYACRHAATAAARATAGTATEPARPRRSGWKGIPNPESLVVRR